MATVATTDTLDNILAVLTWLDWFGLSLVLVLLGVLAYLIWERKYAGTDGKLAMPEITVPTELAMPADSLLRVWRGFVSGIPWRLRPDALSVPLSVVIGDAGCGKSCVIDHYADWQGQAFSFRPSTINDPLLQIYLGAKALVLEFGAALLYDTNPAAYQAMKKLWRHLPPNPQAVMVIDAGTLLAPQAEQLRQSGYAMFGKLKVFGQLEGKPLPLVLTLSQMDKVTGFVEFCAFLEAEGIPLRLEFPERDGITQLETCLENYQQHLPRALLTRPAQDYLKIVSFLNAAPRLFRVLNDFLRVAGLAQDVGSPPVVRLCLLSQHCDSFGSQPFALPPSTLKPPLISLNNHAKAALALLLVGLVYLVWGYRYQQNLETQVFENIKTVRSTPVEYYDEKISPLFLNYSADLNKNALLSFMPKYFTEVDNFNKYLLITEIRKYYLLPLLKQIQLERDADFKTARFIGFLYATPSNEITQILAKTPEKNPIDIEKYGLLMKDYVQNNTHTEELDSMLNSITYANPETDSGDLAPWLVLFRGFNQLFNKPYITEAEFKALQQHLIPFFEVINRFDYYSDAPEIRKWLIQHTNLHLNFSEVSSVRSELRQKNIAQLLGFIKHLEFSDTKSCPPSLSLTGCLTAIQAVANANTPITTAEMNFTLSGEYFSFTPKQWLDFMTRSRVTVLLRNFVYEHSNRKDEGWIFFKSPSNYIDVELNASNSGRLLFSGKARIDGRLTADAVERDVKPSIMALTEIVSKLPIDGYEKKHFEDFVLKNLSAYSDQYVSAYLNYFRQFQVRIETPWDLNYILADLQQPNSQLLETLVQIKTNTALNLSVSPSFKAFSQKLMAFNVIQRLMEEKNGVYPEFQKYQLIMAQMQQEIDSREPYLPKPTDGEAASLKGTFTPLGRVAWATLLNEDSAYTALLKSWLQNVGLQKEWQQPFMAPVQKAVEFGNVEINQIIAGLWSDIWDSNVAPVLVKFPFIANAGADKEVSTDDLTQIFHPKQGVFWVTFQDYLAPLCHLSNGVWVKRQQLSNLVELPTNFQERLNAVQQLTASLWDVQGNPIPLQFLIKPGLLPTFDKTLIPNAPLVSLSYIREGGVSVLGFNQQAEWQKFALEWWAAKPAQVGLEFRKDADPTQVYNEVTVDNSAWNFFRLLQQGQFAGTQQYRWLVNHPNFPQQPLNLEFSFKANPLAVFANLAGS
ncbi:MAG: hypothetical protein WC782_08565 [Methylococcaceae bacterium]|jgi:hypothetical protein